VKDVVAPARQDRAEDEVEIMLAARPQKITFDMAVRGVLVSFRSIATGLSGGQIEPLDQGCIRRCTG
jgi:hypothetical protein